MSPCSRGCCWTGLQVCAHARKCACHWGDWLTVVPTGGADRTYRDPTSREAIANVIKEGRSR